MDWKEIIGKYLPKVAGAAINPVTGGIDLVGSVLGDIFGFDFANTSPDDAEKIISQDPAMKLKLRLAEMDFVLRQREQDLTELKTYIEDIQSARDAKVEGEKATGKRDINIYVMAYLIIAASMGIVIYFIYFGMPKMTPETALMVGGFIGIILGKFGSVIDFFFGSSRGSSDKTEMLNQALIKK